TPIRFSPGWKTHVPNDLFDRAVARQLRDAPPPECFIGFNGQAQHTFETAGRRGCRRFELVAATSHVNHVARQDAKAFAYCDVESSWLNNAQRRKTLREYEMADMIYVGSEYSRSSFMEEGIADDRLIRIKYPIDARFSAAATRPDDEFRVVYTGTITVTKGVPVLLDAFARLADPDARLTLIGGSSTRGMRRYLES